MNKTFSHLAARAWSTSATNRFSAGARWRRGNWFARQPRFARSKNALPKGDMLTVAQIAGIPAAKRTAPK
jgi:hypothetical protein